MIDGRKRNCKLTFKVQSSCVNKKCSQFYCTTSPHKEAVYQELEANSILEPAMNVKK